jgi:hypothetical protein
MVEKFKKISNPLTIIAIFAGLAEVSGTIVLPMLDKSIQPIFIWFLIGFPTLLILLFFITLNFNSRVLYAPADFKNEDNYLKTMPGFKNSKYEITETDININNINQVRGSVKLAAHSLISQWDKTDLKNKLDKLDFESQDKSTERVIVDNANAFFNNLLDISKDFFTKKVIEMIQFGIQSKEFFLLKYKLSKSSLKRGNITDEDAIIINVTKDRFGELKLIAVGKDIIENNPADFAREVFEYIENVINNRVDKKRLDK